MTVVDTEKLKIQLAGEEGRRNKPYEDSLGNLTIGIGRNLDGVGLRNSEIDFLFDNDVAAVQDELARMLPWVFDLDEVRLRVFYDLCFNMGIINLMSFKNALSFAQTRNWDAAADNFVRSKWHSQVGIRAIKLENMLRTGQDQ